MNDSFDLTRRMYRLFLLVPLLFCLMTLPQATQASEGGWAENIELTGDYTGTFTLNSNTAEIFRAEDGVPATVGVEVSRLRTKLRSQWKPHS